MSPSCTQSQPNLNPNADILTLSLTLTDAHPTPKVRRASKESHEELIDEDAAIEGELLGRLLTPEALRRAARMEAVGGVAAPPPVPGGAATAGAAQQQPPAPLRPRNIGDALEHAAAAHAEGASLDGTRSLSVDSQQPLHVAFGSSGSLAFGSSGSLSELQEHQLAPPPAYEPPVLPKRTGM